eukprot:360633-Chlamydomonas_euryale.AAC.11
MVAWLSARGLTRVLLVTPPPVYEPGRAEYVRQKVLYSHASMQSASLPASHPGRHFYTQMLYGLATVSEVVQGSRDATPNACPSSFPCLRVALPPAVPRAFKTCGPLNINITWRQEHRTTLKVALSPAVPRALQHCNIKHTARRSRLNHDAALTTMPP